MSYFYHRMEFRKKSNKRLLTNSGFVEFFGLFWPLFDSNFGGNIRKLILPPKFESKSGSKEPKNRQKLSSLTVSKLLIMLLFCLVGCGTHVSDRIEPHVSYQAQENHFAQLRSAFAPLTAEERASDWGKEMLIANAFAKELDLYRAVFTYKRAEILIPDTALARKLEIQYDILLCYYLGKRYEEALESVEKSGLERVDRSFPAYHDLLLILYECYREVDNEERAERIRELIHHTFPETDEQLKVSIALRSADLLTLAEINEGLSHPSYLDPSLYCYAAEKKSVAKAQVLNALLPGAGYLYLGQRKSAFTAFVLNGLFILAAYQFFHHHHFAAGIITTSFESGWYFGGIYGAGEEAKFYNERLYEKNASRILNSCHLFPPLMLRYAF
jgi:tetratricopeptide (TPR) repeat protein